MGSPVFVFRPRSARRAHVAAKANHDNPHRSLVGLFLNVTFWFPVCRPPSPWELRRRYAGFQWFFLFNFCGQAMSYFYSPSEIWDRGMLLAVFRCGGVSLRDAVFSVVLRFFQWTSSLATFCSFRIEKTCFVRKAPSVVSNTIGRSSCNCCVFFSFSTSYSWFLFGLLWNRSRAKAGAKKGEKQGRWGFEGVFINSTTPFLFFFFFLKNRVVLPFLLSFVLLVLPPFSSSLVVVVDSGSG